MQPTPRSAAQVKIVSANPMGRIELGPVVAAKVEFMAWRGVKLRLRMLVPAVWWID